MDDRRPGDVPRLWRDEPSDSYYPDASLPQYSQPQYSQPGERSGSWLGWYGYLSPSEQLGYGCIGVIFLSLLFLWCVGASTFIARPLLLVRVTPPPTEFIQPTLAPTPTQVVQPTSIIPLPTPVGPMIATPTQAPLPTWAPPTATATFDPNNPYTPTPTKKPNTTVFPTATPTTRR